MKDYMKDYQGFIFTKGFIEGLSQVKEEDYSEIEKSLEPLAQNALKLLDKEDLKELSLELLPDGTLKKIEK